MQATEVTAAAQKGPAGEVTLPGSIGFDGKAMVVCMGRTCAHTGRPHCGTGYVPSRDSILGFPIGPAGPEALPDSADPATSQGSFACKEISGRKALSGIGKPRRA